MIIIRWAINAVALYAAIALVPGLTAENPHWTAYIWMALIFGLVNALVRPILKLLTCPLILLTLGLFTLVINTVMLYLTSYLGDFFGVGLTIDGFFSAFLGALIISAISLVLTSVVKDSERPRSHAKTPR
jgi:putative membrane protein